jgi:Arc/MetJ family transcription regulator
MRRENIAMRMNIEIDEKLLVTAMKAGGYSTKKATVEAALKMLVRKHAYRALLALGGKLKWEGDLEAMRVAR